jgi:hypothetical protein
MLEWPHCVGGRIRRKAAIFNLRFEMLWRRPWVRAQILSFACVMWSIVSIVNTVSSNSQVMTQCCAGADADSVAVMELETLGQC